MSKKRNRRPIIKKSTAPAKIGRVNKAIPYVSRSICAWATGVENEKWRREQEAIDKLIAEVEGC